MSIISTINSPNWLPHCGKYLCSLLMRNMMPAVFYCQRDCLKLRRIKLELSKYVVKTENSWFCLFNFFFHLFFIFIWGHLKFMPGFGPHYSVYWQVLYRPLCWEGSRQFMAGYLCMINLEVVSKDVLGFCLKKKKKKSGRGSRVIMSHYPVLQHSVMWIDHPKLLQSVQIKMDFKKNLLLQQNKRLA